METNKGYTFIGLLFSWGVIIAFAVMAFPYVWPWLVRLIK